MGHSCSSTINPSRDVKYLNPSRPASSSSWVVRISPEEIRKRFEEENSLPVGASDEELIFRTLLEDDIACVYFSDYFATVQDLLDCFKCWRDVLALKRSTNADINVVNAISLYERYLTIGKPLRELGRRCCFNDLRRLDEQLLPLIPSPKSYTSCSSRDKRHDRRHKVEFNDIETPDIISQPPAVLSRETSNISQPPAVLSRETSNISQPPPVLSPETSNISQPPPVLSRETSNISQPPAVLSRETSNSSIAVKNRGITAPPPRLKESFDWLLEKCFSELFDRGYVPFSLTSRYGEMIATIKRDVNHVSEDDFEYLKILGEGAFGLVVHVRKKSTRAHYAMKVQNKQKLLSHTLELPWRVDFEKQTFTSCHHPFIVELSHAFQTRTMVMLVMSLGTAGDLSTQLRAAPEQKFTMKRARFYAAEIALALAYLHSRGLIYRDLKPGNVLLLADGHIQLTDFGAVTDVHGGTLGLASEIDRVPLFSKADKGDSHSHTRIGTPVASHRSEGSLESDQLEKLLGRTHADVTGECSSCSHGRNRSRSNSHSQSYSKSRGDSYAANPRAMSIVGTVGYMAPEVVVMLSQRAFHREGYSYAVDWWSLGVLLYRMLVGHTPFQTNPARVYASGVGPITADEHQLRGLKRLEEAGAKAATLMLRIVGTGRGGPAVDAYLSLFRELDCSMLETEEEGDEGYAAADIITGLLDVVDSVRLGSGVTGAHEVCAHPFFYGVDWARLDAKKETPPYIPTESVKTVNIDGLSSIRPEFGSFSEMLHSTGHAEWLKVTHQNPRYQQWFDTWDFSSAAAIVAERDALTRNSPMMQTNLVGW